MSSEGEDFQRFFSGDGEFYRAPERPADKVLQYKVPSTGAIMAVHVVGHHVLWANYIWNGSHWLSDYIDAHPELFAGKSVLELGAGAGLPSILAVRAGARRVIATDYPDAELIENIQKNIDGLLDEGSQRKCITAKGYLWGSDVSSLLAENDKDRFDLIFMCDTIFNHSEHRALLKTISSCLSDSASSTVWCVFSHYRPLLKDKDLELLRLAESEFALEVVKVDERRYDELVIDRIRGDPEETKNVYAYTFRRSK